MAWTDWAVAVTVTVAVTVGVVVFVLVGVMVGVVVMVLVSVIVGDRVLVGVRDGLADPPGLVGLELLLPHPAIKAAGSNAANTIKAISFFTFASPWKIREL